jgi:MoxR-like ATPase
MDGDDPLFVTTRAPASPPSPPAAPLPAAIDRRAVARAVGALTCALGTPTEAEIARANVALARLALPPLSPRELQQASPESLLPLIPVELHAPLLSLLCELAGDEPIRARLCQSWAGLMQLHARRVESRSPSGHRVVRWLIGKLPQHVNAVEEERMSEAPYRQAEPHQPVAAPPPLSLRERARRVRLQFEAVRDAVEQVIIGKRPVIERVLTAVAARGHVLLVDAPGTGKTQLCKAIAAAIELKFSRVQFTPDLLPLDVTGASVFDPRDRQFVFRPGPVFTNLLLADEINRATPKTQSALLEVMEERSVTVDGTTHTMAAPFFVLATMNPLDHQGTYALPAAQIDRFMIMLELGVPAPDDEVRMLERHLGARPALDAIEPVIGRDELIDWQETVPLIHVAPAIKRVAVALVNQLRREADDARSVSPRATLAWVRLAQARALLSGREFVSVEDLLDVAPDVLRHRLWTDGAAIAERLRAHVATLAAVDTGVAA